MRLPVIEIDVLDDDLDDNYLPSAWELGLEVDLAREELYEDEGDDDLGFRSLYENPEAVLGSAGWPSAA